MQENNQIESSVIIPCPDNILEEMKSLCNYWDNLYCFNNNTKNIVQNEFPFTLIRNNGILFTSNNNPQELKSDETLLLNKAIKRIGKTEDIDYVKALSVAVKVAHHEKSDKIKLYHGFIKKEMDNFSSEISFLTINDKVIDFANDIRGVIPFGYDYYGINIPKEILYNNVIMKGFGLSVDLPNYEYKPIPNTIFMKTYLDLKKYYGQKK